MDEVNHRTPVPLSNPDDFAAFYAQALPRVYTYFYYRARGSSEAEDLTQETFFAAVAELNKGRSVTEPIGWIMGIARHKLIDCLRNRAREERRLALIWQAAEVDDQDARLRWEGDDTREQALAALNAYPGASRRPRCHSQQLQVRTDPAVMTSCQ